jgi:hypothetical protein
MRRQMEGHRRKLEELEAWVASRREAARRAAENREREFGKLQ